MPRNRTPRSFDLTRGQPTASDRAKTEISEAHFAPGHRETAIAAFVLLAKFGSLRLKHLEKP
jgi:hypothetical protein